MVVMISGKIQVDILCIKF